VSAPQRLHSLDHPWGSEGKHRLRYRRPKGRPGPNDAVAVERFVAVGPTLCPPDPRIERQPDADPAFGPWLALPRPASMPASGGRRRNSL